ncbi:AraC family transcriptional regulator [Sphingosinicella sp. LHD-64]|uniref:AraC family transcriptional regulator n=1 Tax=Sphingosinicella sp. LHD-64 TaxID=3072139 RepID=UPI00280E1A13|nr:AraC family transcriptional regulator [Sphingosinicella sp. LHD-64]MDQ8758089.1 AraC family transcriptional regulator [Sphingosinicella sp. LHD-64]
MATDGEFLVETTGPALPRRSALYAAGEDLRRGYAGAVFERRYHGPIFGVVESGAFKYHCESGEAIVAPGSIIFGNAGESFGCAHLDDKGNRRSVVAIADGLLEEAAEEAGAQPRFATAIFAPGPRNLAMQAAIRQVARSREALEDVVVALLVDAFGLEPASVGRSSEQEARRILDVVRFLESRFDEPNQLTDLAAAAGISRFHFLRQFRRLVGISPTQFLIGLRLRAAAERLEDGAAPVTEIALDVGFNDISHFNQLFRRAYRMPPSRWRARRQAKP